MRLFPFAPTLTVVLALVSGLSCRSDREVVPSSSIPSPTVRTTPQYESAQQAFEALKRPPEITTVLCEELPGLDPGEAGVLLCGKVGVVGSDRLWEVGVWMFDDTFHAEATYRKECKSAGSPLWWTVWEEGQRWIAEISDRNPFPEELPPRLVADAIGSALGGTARKDCSAVS